MRLVLRWMRDVMAITTCRSLLRAREDESLAHAAARARTELDEADAAPFDTWAEVIGPVWRVLGARKGENTLAAAERVVRERDRALTRLLFAPASVVCSGCAAEIGPLDEPSDAWRQVDGAWRHQCGDSDDVHPSVTITWTTARVRSLRAAWQRVHDLRKLADGGAKS